MEDDLPEPVRALMRWAQEHHGGSVDLVEPPRTVGDGFDSAVHLVHLSGGQLPAAWRAPLVLRVKADADRAPEAEHEAAIQGWLADHGYPVPRVLRVFDAGELIALPAQLMERAPGLTMLDQVRATPVRARRLCAQLAALHTNLHSIDPEGFPRSEDVLDRRLRLTRWVAAALDDSQLRRALDRVESSADPLRNGPVSVCHGDFHPLNVMVSGGEAMVIDWTDAGVGDRHGDIARTLLLFELATVAANGAAERVVLRAVGPWLARTYRRAYERERPIDDERIRMWRPVHLLHGWSQARALHAGLFDRDHPGDDRTERIRPRVVAELERRFEQAMAG